MKTTPLISIVTVNLDDAHGLEQTMASVFQQDYPRIEYIVIDGGSTDKSPAVLAGNAHRLHWWESQPDNGIYHAMNKGLAKTNGDYVLFLNSGDKFVSPASLSGLALKIDGQAVIYGNLLMDGETGVYLKTYPGDLPPYYFLYESLPHPASLIKTALLKKAGGYDEGLKICADWKFFLNLFLQGNHHFKHVDLAVAHFSPGGISSLSANINWINSEKRAVITKEVPSLLDRFDRQHFTPEKTFFQKLRMRLGKWKVKLAI